MTSKFRKLFAAIMTVTLLFGSNLVVAETTVYEKPLTGYVNDTDVIVRTGPGTNYAQMKSDGKLLYYPNNQQLQIIGEDFDTRNEKWYKVSWTYQENEIESWIRNDFVRIQYEFDENDEFVQQILQNYPDLPKGYIEKLAAVHQEHPAWNIEIYDTKLQWDTVIAKESRIGFNLISGSNLAYRSTEPGAYDRETGKFIPLDGTNWFAANSQTIAYYIDPRNFIDSKNIFMFLSLSYKEIETPAVVQKVINGTFMQDKDKVSGKNYADIFHEAGENAQVSPVYLASLARQEQGVSGSVAVTGQSFTYNGKTYSGLYNFYNIGATSGTDNWKKGLIYANGGENGTATSYLRPWKSPYKAIMGGALFIADGYISVGQNTMYFHKFNVTSYMTYSHQYMTNVQAAVSQASILYSAYKNASALDQPLTFTVPIFRNMPEKTELPTTYELPGPEEPDPQEPVASGDLIVDLDLLNTSGYLTGFRLGITYQELKNQISALENNAYEVQIVDENGIEIANSAVLSTGLKFNFTSDGQLSSYTVIIRGDLNGDGKINAQDLLLAKKGLLEIITLSDVQKQAAMISDSTTFSTRDYLAMKKHYLGVKEIDQ
ncbi:MAG: hypothetical protein II712_00505 [Erysipelotrichaceae bacterium]|nr:hypothetical protein [Erysipelotrichaceae bacterium]